MYSRETYGRELRIPPRYSGTAFRQEERTERDAVGRPSALPDARQTHEETIPLPKKEVIKAPPPMPIDKEKEEDIPTVQSIKNNYSDEIIIGALIFSLIGGGRGGEEDITLLLLLLLLIL